jgi:hypothetical protein
MEVRSVGCVPFPHHPLIVIDHIRLDAHWTICGEPVKCRTGHFANLKSTFPQMPFFGHCDGFNQVLGYGEAT